MSDVGDNDPLVFSLFLVVVLSYVFTMFEAIIHACHLIHLYVVPAAD